MPSYHTTNYRSYDRSMEMLGRSMMLATISEEQLADDVFCCGSSPSSYQQTLGLKRTSSALSQSYKTGLAELAQAAGQHHQGSIQQQQQPPQSLSAQEDNDCWGFFMDDQ